MKKIFLLLLVIALPIFILAQETEKKFGVNLSGFVRNDITYNTRQVVSARGQANILLAPKPIELDEDGNDINEAGNFNMVGLTTRLRAKIKGADAFGAKTSGLIEMDFVGYANSAGAVPFSLRLRHAMFKLDWGKSQLLIGQYWHPMWATECYAGTVSFGAGLPFNPLSRNPQIRFTHKLGRFSLLGAILSHGMFISKAGSSAFQNSGVPELHAQVQFKNDIISAGLGINFQVLKPRLSSIVTDSMGVNHTYATSETINSLSYFGYIKTSFKPLTIKLYGMYGQNNDNLVMMGGYAIIDKVYSQNQINKGFVEYAPYNTLSSWADFETTGKKLTFGLFAGYSQNMGATTSIQAGTFVGRWGNVNTMLRIAPRVVYKINKIKLGFELEYSQIDYAKQEVDTNGIPVVGSNVGGISTHGTVTNFDTADNIRFLLSLTYLF